MCGIKAHYALEMLISLILIFFISGFIFTVSKKILIGQLPDLTFSSVAFLQ
jgi:hypothetical protein